MDESEIIRQLREQNELLRLENEMLKARIRELEARLAQYVNAHAPPSLRQGRNRKKNKDTKDKGKPGQKVGHKDVTRPLAIPDSQVEVTADRCPDCGAKLNLPFRFESKVIEEIPDPQPVIVTEYKIAITYVHAAGKKSLLAMQIARMKTNSEITLSRRRP